MKRAVEVKKDGLYLDGEKFFLISGDLHYFRVHESGWEQRLLLMKDFGLTAVTTYVPWNMHEPRRGEFFFEGRADLLAFLRLAERVGLKVILRCSPYMCGEWEFGGLPAWLLKEKNICLRSSDPKFIEPLDEYNTVLCDMIRPYLYTNGGPIILVGIENEYGSFGDDLEYLAYLRNFYKERDIDVPFISANGMDSFKYDNGALPSNWNGIDLGAYPQSLPQLDMLEAVQPDKPLMVGEAWVGSIMFWGKMFVRQQTGKEHAEFMLEALKRGACINFYMFCGGTNFGFMNGALHGVSIFDGYVPLLTSYDYNAPVTEQGTPTEKYFEMRDALDSFLGRPPREHVMPKYETQSIELKLTESARLFDNMDVLTEKSVYSYKTVCMEDMDQSYGFICYTTRLRYTDSRVRHLIVEGLADRATVYIDGEYIGTLMRDAENPDITFTVKEGGSELTVLVENMGRINYGYKMYDQKGIKECIRFRIENPDGSFLYNYASCMGYRIASLPLTSTDGVRYGDGLINGSTPCFYRGSFEARGGVDTFIDMTGWSRGIVWINGFNLGRYWSVGPQRTLYVPCGILKERNTVEIFELHAPNKDFAVRCIDEPKLCEPVESSLNCMDFELR